MLGAAEEENLVIVAALSGGRGTSFDGGIEADSAHKEAVSIG